jgi:hypothetical protein
MSIIDILVILGCLAGGYWIVSSVMGPGVDITRREQQAPPVQQKASLQNSHKADWYLLLDVPRTASRPEIEAAYQRQQQKAAASFDTHQMERLRLAREAGLAQHALSGKGQ